MKRKMLYLIPGLLMLFLSAGTPKTAASNVLENPCDIECYCGSLFMIIQNPANGSEAIELAVNAWNLFNCPTGNPSPE